jgi:hypothetical protein
MDHIESELKHIRRQRLLCVVVIAGVIALLGACTNVMPAATSATRAAPTPSNVTAPAQSQPTAPPVSASPAASPTSGKPFRMPDALLSPADLTFSAAYPAEGWHRCDDYAVDRNLEKFRKDYEVAESAAAVWQHGSSCNSVDQKARLDEYAWRMQNQDAVVKLSGFLGDTSYFDQLTPELRKQVRELERESVLVRISPVESNGKTLYVAEMIGQAGLDVTYMRIATAEALADEDYLGIARLGLDRLAAGAR